MGFLLALAAFQTVDVPVMSRVHADSSSIFRDFTPGAEAKQETASSVSRELAGDYSVIGTNPNGSRYQGLVAITHEGRDRYSFRWVIGKDTFRGQGTLVGKTLTVEWGDVSPVVYQVMENGTLDGLWHNGRGTETLVPKNR